MGGVPLPRLRALLRPRFLSALAIQMQNVGVGWLVYDLTSDPLALGLVGLAGSAGDLPRPGHRACRRSVRPPRGC